MFLVEVKSPGGEADSLGKEDAFSWDFGELHSWDFGELQVPV